MGEFQLSATKINDDLEHIIVIYPNASHCNRYYYRSYRNTVTEIKNILPIANGALSLQKIGVFKKFQFTAHIHEKIVSIICILKMIFA